MRSSSPAGSIVFCVKELVGEVRVSALVEMSLRRLGILCPPRRPRGVRAEFPIWARRQVYHSEAFPLPDPALCRLCHDVLGRPGIIGSRQVKPHEGQERVYAVYLVMRKCCYVSRDGRQHFQFPIPIVGITSEDDIVVMLYVLVRKRARSPEVDQHLGPILTVKGSVCIMDISPYRHWLCQAQLQLTPTNRRFAAHDDNRPSKGHFLGRPYSEDPRIVKELDILRVILMGVPCSGDAASASFLFKLVEQKQDRVKKNEKKKGKGEGGAEERRKGRPYI